MKNLNKALLYCIIALNLISCGSDSGKSTSKASIRILSPSQDITLPAGAL
ncbi:MAG: hypothetical protein R3A13_12040 [Bdellovibrionota bacterium]